MKSSKNRQLVVGIFLLAAGCLLSVLNFTNDADPLFVASFIVLCAGFTVLVAYIIYQENMKLAIMASLVMIVAGSVIYELLVNLVSSDSMAVNASRVICFIFIFIGVALAIIMAYKEFPTDAVVVRRQ